MLNQDGLKSQMSHQNFHERYVSNTEVKAGSDRGFGLVFAVVFGIIGLWPLVGGGGGVRIWALTLGAVFLLVALAAPQILAPLNRLWFRLGILLGRIATPLVMGALFYVTVLPTALVLRAMGKDPLRLRRDSTARSYWIERDPPGPKPESLDHQF